MLAGITQFFSYNGKKVLLLWGATFVGTAVFLLLLVRYINFVQPLIISLIVAALMTIAFTIKGIVFFAVAHNIISDTSDKSITGLFENGYTVELQNTDSMLYFTIVILRGTIRNYPVAVYFPVFSRNKTPELTFNFYPLLLPDGTSSKRNISFRLGVKRNLRSDIKPDVLAFIAQLKLDGYKPSA
jgi:hypothetical protein